MGVAHLLQIHMVIGAKFQGNYDTLVRKLGSTILFLNFIRVTLIAQHFYIGFQWCDVTKLS